MANLTSANLKWANLTDVQLSEANLTDTYLIRANLTDARLDEANLTDDHLREAKFNRANLATVKNLTQQQLDSAQGNETTQLPARLQRPAHWSAESTAPPADR